MSLPREFANLRMMLDALGVHGLSCQD